jgi:hypothetical protein
MITQEANQSSRQIEEEDDAYTIKKRVQKKLLSYYQHKKYLPRKIRISPHNIISLEKEGLITTIFYLKDTNVIVDFDSRMGDEVECSDA